MNRTPADGIRIALPDPADLHRRVTLAAPDLLAALQACLPFIDDAGDIAQFYPESSATVACRTAVANARAAIAKATGGTA